MIKNFVIIGLIWLGGQFIYGIDFAEYYELVVNYLSGNELNLLVYGTLGSICFVFISFVLRDVGFFSLMHMLSNFVFELSQFAICFVSIFAVIFVFQLQHNLWLDLGILAVIPIEVLLASCTSLYLYDFNYPLGEKLLDNTGVLIFSGLFVLISRLIQN